MKKCTVVLIMIALATAACESDQTSEAEAASAETEAAAEAPAEPGAEAPAEEEAEAKNLVLEELELTIALPADSNVSDMMGAKMIQGGGTVVTVKALGEDDTAAPKTFEEGKKAAQDHSPTEITTEEQGEDGWTLAFTNEGSLGKSYFVWVRKKIGDTLYSCEMTANSPEQAEKAAKACASLAPMS